MIPDRFDRSRCQKIILRIAAYPSASIIPIAATGQFARMAGYHFLSMVERKVRWLQSNSDKLANVLES